MTGACGSPETPVTGKHMGKQGEDQKIEGGKTFHRGRGSPSFGLHSLYPQIKKIELTVNASSQPGNGR